MEENKGPQVAGGNTDPRQRERNWCFTSYIEPVWKELTTYFICQPEICPKTKKNHWQGYVEFKLKKSLKQLKKIDEKAHWEPRRGTQEQAIEYCKKIASKNGEVIEWGNKAQKGKRNDLIELKETLDNGQDHYEINFGAAIKYPRGIAEYKKNLMKKKFGKEQRNVETLWISGLPGTGKTRKAYELAPNLFRLPTIKKGNVWLDGYEGEETLLIDDLGYNQIIREELLGMLDRYPIQLPIKGGFVWAGWKYVIITSNYSYKELYNNDAAINRRITYAQEAKLEQSGP